MAQVAITVPDAVVTKLQQKFGSLPALRTYIVQHLKRLVTEEDLGEWQKTRHAADAAAFDAAMEAQRQVVETTYS